MTRRITALLVFLCAMLLVAPCLGDQPNLSTFLGDKAVATQGPWYAPGNEPETAEQRATRVRMIADVIVEVAPRALAEYEWYWSVEDLIFAAYAKTYNESGHWDIMIHSGKKRGDHGHSTCLGQIWGGGNKLVGTDREHTAACIMAVMKHLTFHQHRCLNSSTPSNTWSMAQVFSGYGTGWSCREGIWRAEKNSYGVDIVGSNGEPIKEHWARDRAAMWGRLRKEWKQLNAQ